MLFNINQFLSQDVLQFSYRYQTMITKSVFFLFVILIIVNSIADEDKGQYRLRRMRQMADSSSNKIIQFNFEQFKQFALSYPRPYDIVAYFKAPSCKLCEQLEPQYDYMAQLYYQQGAITAQKNPTFFVKISYSRVNQQLFQMFQFMTAPNLVVSKPHMAVVSEIEKKAYHQKFKWAISHSDGHVTTHKMLQFTNKRTDRDIIYKPTLSTMLTTFFGFVAVASVGVFVYLNMQSIWTNWIVWFFGSILIYITCMSGVVYDIIHDVPFVGRDPKTGQALIFSGGNRQQYGAEGLLLSMLLTGIGLLFIINIVLGSKLSPYISRILYLVSLALIFILVNLIEQGYKTKSWYGPSLFPPGEYRTGSIASDQGNNI